MSRICLAVAALAAVVGLSFVAVDFADARAGRGGSSGSRGGNTHTAPPATNTTPKGAAPVERSMTQPGKATSAATGAAAGAANTATAASRFGGMKGLLTGALIGAGLASLFGMGGGLAAMLGFMLQMLLIAGIVMLIVAFFRSRQAKPALAEAGAGPAAQQPQNAAFRANVGGTGAALPPLAIQADDFGTFERLLGEVQSAYGQGDLKSLETRTTPEMLSYFAHEIDDLKKQGQRNEIGGGKLLQGDLSEAWREAGAEYASVAMRYEILDATIEVVSGRVVSGSRTEPQQVTEVWTFVRPVNGRADQWELSAIQQAA